MLNSLEEYDKENLKLSICNWLALKIQAMQCILAKVHIFGSVARSVGNPNDCDVLMVAIPKCSEEQWLLIRNMIPELKEDFVHQFDLPLSVVLLTYSEWIELQDFFGYDRVTIV